MISERQGRTDSDWKDLDGAKWISTRKLTRRHEALPCTGPKDPINFEVFSAGPGVSGLPLTGVVRRCDPGAPAGEAPANSLTYVYGHCEIASGSENCSPPLQVQTWPACQRSLGEYSFNGKPLPYRDLPSPDGAQIVEIDFPLEGPRIEVYTRSSTVVIFASSAALASAAVDLLRSQKTGTPAASSAKALGHEPRADLEPPTEGATEGDLECPV